jgi:hypothetical protein
MKRLNTVVSPKIERNRRAVMRPEAIRQLIVIHLLFLVFTIGGCRREVTTNRHEVNQAQLQNVSMKEKEALDRKKRSMAQLRAERIPVNEGLPIIEIESEAKFRSTEQVALRAMALCVVASRAEGLDENMTKKLIADFRLSETLTPKEKEFMFNPNPSAHDRSQFVWRYECCWALLWALGFVEDLKTPNSICDVQLVVRIIRDHGRDDFLKKARLRSKAEILDTTDLVYRYHWAVRDAQLNGRKSPTGLNPDVVMERHYVLNWIVGYLGQEWDDVSTDT